MARVTDGVGAPDRSPLADYRARADELLRAVGERDEQAARRFVHYHPEARGLAERQVLLRAWSRDDAELVVARDARFADWGSLTEYLAALADPESDAARFEAAADAVVTGDEAALRELLALDSELARARSPRPHRATLLHYSASNGVEDHRQRVPPNAVAIATLLVEAGADLNATADFYGGGPGSTPLVGLVTSCHPDEAGLMEALVRAYAESGQSLDGTEADGLPMTMALLFRYPHAARTLAECGARVDNAALAAGIGRLDLVEAWVRPGSPPTADPGGLKAFDGTPRTARETPEVALYFAAIAGETEIARALLSRGVDPSARGNHGMTALHEAAWGGHLDLVRLLVEAGAAVDLRERQFGATPVGWAAHGGRLNVVAYLLENAAVDLVDLVELGETGRVRTRVEGHPAEVDGADGSGAPLRAAAAAGNLELLRVLLDAGADPGLTDREGRTALDRARDFGRTAAVELLESLA